MTQPKESGIAKSPVKKKITKKGKTGKKQIRPNKKGSTQVTPQTANKKGKASMKKKVTVKKSTKATATGIWKTLVPKHIHLKSYRDVILEVGALIHYSTIRGEGKNGHLKRMAVAANNGKNPIATIMRSCNEYQVAILD